MDYLLRNTPPKSLMFRVLYCSSPYLVCNTMDLVSGRYILVYIKFLAKVRKNPVIQRDFLWILTIICGFHYLDALFVSFSAQIRQRLLA